MGIQIVSIFYNKVFIHQINMACRLILDINTNFIIAAVCVCLCVCVCVRELFVWYINQVFYGILQSIK